MMISKRRLGLAMMLIAGAIQVVFVMTSSRLLPDQQMRLWMGVERTVDVSRSRPHFRTERPLDLGGMLSAGTFEEALLRLQRQSERALRPLSNPAVEASLRRVLTATNQQREILGDLSASLTPSQDAVLRQEGLSTSEMPEEYGARFVPFICLDVAIEGLCADACAFLSASRDDTGVQLRPRRRTGAGRPQILLSIFHLALSARQGVSPAQRVYWSKRLASLRRVTQAKRQDLLDVGTRLTSAQRVLLDEILTSLPTSPTSLSFQVITLKRLLDLGHQARGSAPQG